MKENDNIEEMFKRLEGKFNLEETPAGHEKRFMERLQTLENRTKQKSFNVWKSLSIAASVALLLTVGFYNINDKKDVSDLASVSPEMEKTQSFFITTINQEIEKLKSFEDADSQKLVDDALQSLAVLEQNFEKLKLDLAQSGNDKRVVAAMIANFQSRIEILEQVLITIEEIKTLKANRNETTI
jgi:hypothetical protein